MKNPKTNTKDIFNEQLKNFKILLHGSKMAKLSSLLLAVFSLVTAYKIKSNLQLAIPMLLGGILQILYIIKYLNLEGMTQKSYTQMSLQNSISKFKLYMYKRKKYEMFVVGFWIITMVPYALDNESILIIITASVLCVALVSFFGNLAFKKVDSNIELLEATLIN